MQVHVTMKSASAKTGPIPVSTTEKSSCPVDCQVRDACYAASGPLALHWAAVSNGTRGTSWGQFRDTVAAMPAGKSRRHNQAGDLPQIDGTVDAVKLGQLVAANAGRRGFTYSHAPRRRVDCMDPPRQCMGLHGQSIGQRFIGCRLFGRSKRGPRGRRAAQHDHDQHDHASGPRRGYLPSDAARRCELRHVPALPAPARGDCGLSRPWHQKTGYRYQAARPNARLRWPRGGHAGAHCVRFNQRKVNYAKTNDCKIQRDRRAHRCAD